MARFHRFPALFALQVLLSVLLLLAVVVSAADEDGDETIEEDFPCIRMGDIYNDGEDLCNRIFGDSFLYVPRSSPDYNFAYTMWFFDADNPNDATTKRRVADGKHPDPTYQSTDVCWLKTPGVTAHNSRPLNQSVTFTECHPFKNNACCDEATVEDVNTIQAAYGDEWRWDRCGPISQECERFFVQENCFYECDPNVGLFRKFTPAEVTANPELADRVWEIERMPIKGDYCDAWFDACREELFCGDGDFFTCKRYPPGKPSDPLSGGAIAGIVIGSIVVATLLLFLIILIRNERLGKPVFQKISVDDSRPIEKPRVAGTVANEGIGASPAQQHITTV